MNEYQKAYSILGLEPGTNKESIQRRYKRLVMVWHPDRFPTEEGRKDAEEELKKINNAKDLLWKHFDKGEHKASGCVCQGSAAKSESAPPPRPKPNPHPPPQPNPGPGPGPKQKTAAEQEAERRDAERRAQQEAGSKQQQQSQTAAFADAMKKQPTYDAEKLRWKIALGEGAVFLAICLYSWIGSGIGAAIRSNTNSSDNNNQATTVVEKKDDPCSLAGTYSAPPDRISSTVLDAAKSKATVWTVKCDGTAGGATLEARDPNNRLVLVQVIAPDWSVDHQDFIEANVSSNEITVSRYKQPSDYIGRCIYRYDNANHLLEAVKQDSQNNVELTATVERTKFGKFYALNVRPEGGNATTYYDTSGTDAKAQFYMSSLCMNIDKFVEPAPTLTGPDAAAPSAPVRTEPFPWQTKMYVPEKTPDVVRPADPFTTSTSTDTGTSSTPHLDELLNKYK